ncbi:MAG: molybdopterin-dependent oxidoreductase [Chloroflexi bacterium]|nr:molybdopterin-dependent oxidoreductase [Chloroflexota bacterium]
MADTEKVINTICRNDCGGGCVLKVYIRDGAITRIGTDESEGLQYRACAKGRAHRQWMHSSDRLKYPMKRTGERGEGKFARISWDEALDRVASEMERIKNTYGPSAILLQSRGGDLSQLHRKKPMERLLSLWGGYSTTWGFASYEGAVFGSLVTYGTTFAANDRDDLLNARLIIMWGLDVASTIHHNNTRFYLAQAREKGTRIISVDPKYTNSTAAFADQWIPIRPGTDTAMLIAMAYVMVKENLHDRSFLEKYTAGFERFKEYILGDEDGLPKTPSWAESITGVKAETITGLAREYAAARPAALMPGWSAGRTPNGEQFHRAIMVLAAMNGNVGIHGGNSGIGVYGETYNYNLGDFLPVGSNPVERGALRRKNALSGSGEAGSSARVHNCKVWDAILEGKAGGYPADYKMLYLINSNYLNQHPNVNKGVKALKALEFIVTQEQFMTATARFADILLPTAYFMERNDVVTGGGLPFYGFMNKVIKPYFESRTHFEIAVALAERLGITNFNDKNEEELLKQIVAGSKDIPDYETLKEGVIHRIKLSEPGVAFKKQIEDLGKNPFPTPSGKIEIYSQQLADMQEPMIPPIPKYIETWEGLSDPLAKKYPLQLITSHPKLRVHSQFYNVPWLTELESQEVIINASDARARDIEDGDWARVFNDRGETVIRARVTERIMPGVVDIPEGGWYTPDQSGIDKGGCANILTRDESSPGGAFVGTCLVEVRKAEE